MCKLSCHLVVLLSMAWAASPLRAQEANESAARKINLPAAVDKVIRAGRGDVLVLQMNGLAKAAIFDVKTEKISGYIPLGGSDALATGTADSVILLARDKKVLQRWTLQPLKKALTVALSLTDQIDGIEAGYAGSAPILVMTREGPRFLNPTTLKILQTKAAEGRMDWRPRPQSPIHVAASADGWTFAGWAIGSSPSGIRTLRLEGDKLVGKYEHSSAGEQYPSADGSLLFTAAGVFNSDLKPLDQGEQRVITFPSIHPAYYVGLAYEGGGFSGEGRPNVFLFGTSDRTMLISFDELPGLGSRDPFDRDRSLSLYERIIAHPAAKKLVIVDESRTFLHVLPLDVAKALDERGIDYLFVESLPVTTASVGKPYEYEIKVLSKVGNLKFTLDSGPEGMTISPEGMLRWDVPKDFDETKPGVIVSIEDGSTQSILHSFAIYLNV